MTFLLLLPILQLVEGISSQMFREEGPSLQGCPASEEQKYRTVCQTASAPLDWVPGIMCPRPAHAPTPTPTPDGGQPAWLFLACPITSGPRDSNQAVQMAVAGCRRRGPQACWRRGWEWPCHTGMNTSLQAGRSLLEEVCWLQSWEGQGRVGVGAQGNKSSGMGGDSSCYLIQVSELG